MACFWNGLIASIKKYNLLTNAQQLTPEYLINYFQKNNHHPKVLWNDSLLNNKLSR